jgi:hypothetical protein
MGFPFASFFFFLVFVGLLTSGVSDPCESKPAIVASSQAVLYIRVYNSLRGRGSTDTLYYTVTVVFV